MPRAHAIHVVYVINSYVYVVRIFDYQQSELAPYKI